jgi:hypothetical protein
MEANGLLGEDGGCTIGKYFSRPYTKSWRAKLIS